jgi:SAM-dependent methyltransferase
VASVENRIAGMPHEECATRLCTVCATPSRIEKRLSAIDLYRCPGCDHCFSDLSRTLDRELYHRDYYDLTHRNWFEHPNLDLFETIHSTACAVAPAPSVLDVGCGQGDFLRYMQGHDADYDLTGIDLGENREIPGVNLLQGDFQTHRFNRQYDVVVSLAAIEHVADVHGFARRLRELCAPNGVVVVMTMNDRSVLYALARWLYAAGWQTPLDRLYDKHHVNHFNVASLARLLTSEGLIVERTIRHNAPFAALDFPAASTLTTMAMRVGVWGAFGLGRLIGRTYLQTVVCRWS